MEDKTEKKSKPPNLSIPEIEEKIKGEELVRQSRIKKYEEWIGFGASKITGLSFLATGTLETYLPEFLPIVIENSPEVAGVGLALLMGKNAIDFIGNLFDGLRKDK